MLVDLFLEAHERAPREIVLDLDNTDIPLHGVQEGRFFHGYYDEYRYLPLYVFCGRHLLLARQRRANVAGSDGAVEEMARIVAQIRQRWPRVRIILRADSGFSNDELMGWCEANRVDYVFGLARNRRLEAALVDQLAEAKRLSTASGQPARVFRDFWYCTIDSWRRTRRVVGKAEHTLDGANPRFIVTSLKRTRVAYDARALYEDLYCARGEAENRIGEQFELFADRASSATMQANQLRMSFSAMAYVLVDTLRRVGLRHSQFADAAVATIRLKLLKLGAQVRTSVRRIHFAIASGCPNKDEFELAYLPSARLQLRLSHHADAAHRSVGQTRDVTHTHSESRHQTRGAHKTQPCMPLLHPQQRKSGHNALATPAIEPANEPVASGDPIPPFATLTLTNTNFRTTITYTLPLQEACIQRTIPYQAIVTTPRIQLQLSSQTVGIPLTL